jgi:hypothetical protein
VVVDVVDCQDPTTARPAVDVTTPRSAAAATTDSIKVQKNVDCRYCLCVRVCKLLCGWLLYRLDVAL